MATPIGHSWVAVVTYALTRPRCRLRAEWLRLIWYVLLASLPDFDMLRLRLEGVAINTAVHRGGSHSLAFAILVGLLVAGWIRGRFGTWGWREPVIAGWLVASHSLLDLLCDMDPDNGIGVPLFYPFSAARYAAAFAGSIVPGGWSRWHAFGVLAALELVVGGLVLGVLMAIRQWRGMRVLVGKGRA